MIDKLCTNAPMSSQLSVTIEIGVGMMKVRKKVRREFPATAGNKTRKRPSSVSLICRHIEILEDLARLSAHVISYF